MFDFKKAFDVVHHATLLDKLWEIGIRGNLYNWIKDFLSHRTMNVALGGSKSSPKTVLSGVPQGSVLGPLLFIIFINYLVSSLTCEFMIFADDLKLYLNWPKSWSQSPAIGLEHLQRNIDILAKTAASWGLQFSPQKCVNLRFQRPTVRVFDETFYTLNEAPISLVSKHRDLGLTVDISLRFHEHARETTNKAGGVVSNLLKATVCREPEFMKKLLITDIRPILDFASPLWNLGYEGDMKQAEAVQRRWTRQINGFENISYKERLIKLELFSLQGRFIRADLIQCWKIFNGESVIAPEDLFRMCPDRRTRGHRFKIQPQLCSIEARKRFFTNRVVKYWNQLPDVAVAAPSVDIFKSMIYKHCYNLLYEFSE